MPTGFRAYSRNRQLSVDAFFSDPQSTLSNSGYGPLIIPADWTHIMDRRYVMFLGVAEIRATLVVAYLSSLYGNYTVNGPSSPPTEVDEFRQVLSFRSVFDAVNQINTPANTANVLGITYPDNWPDFVNGSSVDLWTPPPSQFCSTNCSGLVTFLEYPANALDPPVTPP